MLFRTGKDRATPAAQSMDRAGYDDVNDIGGLQYMDTDGTWCPHDVASLAHAECDDICGDVAK